MIDDKQKATTLYYDAQCPLCRREVAALSRLTKSDLKCVDAHEINDDEERKQKLLLLHLYKNGNTYVGLDANIEMWQSTRFGWMWKTLKLPLIYQASKVVYVLWAERRYRKRYLAAEN